MNIEQQVDTCETCPQAEETEEETLMTDGTVEFHYKFHNVFGGVLDKLIYNEIQKEIENNMPLFRDSFSLTVEKESILNIFSRFEKLGRIIQLDQNIAVVSVPQKKSFIYLNIDNMEEIKTVYCEVFSQTISKVIEFEKIINDVLSDIIIDKKASWCTIEWMYINSRGGTIVSKFTEKLDDVIYQEAYPNFNIEKTCIDYLNSNEPILILVGPPGTGKTRLIRYILKHMASKCSSNNVSTVYTTNKDIIERGDIFLYWLVNKYQILILEDIDTHLKSRESGNEAMYHILSTSNGLPANLAANKKIIMSTNLSNLDSVDKALLRSGRCFGVIKTDLLSTEESKILLRILNPKIDENVVLTKERYTISDIYKISKNGYVTEKTVFNKIGF